MNKIKVLHMFSSTTIGGAEKMTLLTAVSLNKLSNEIIPVIAAPAGSFLYEQAKENGVHVCDFTCRGSFTPSGVVRLINIIRKEKIDILHVHQGKLYWTALLMKLFFLNIKVVLHRRQDTRHKWYARCHYNFADMTLTVSKVVMNNLIKYEKVSKNKIKVLYNSFDFDNFAKDVACRDIIEKYNLENKFVIGTVGAIVSLEGKGQKYLLEALSKLKNKYTDLRCLIVGDGQGKQRLQDYAETLKVGDITFFVGYQQNVAKYINAMNVFCLLSCGTEGFGNVNVEAQYLSKPVITTDIGGIPETIINNKTAVMIKPRNVEEIIGAIEKLINNKDYAKAMGIEGHKFVSETFSMQKMVNNLTQVYKEIVQ